MGSLLPYLLNKISRTDFKKVQGLEELRVIDQLVAVESRALSDLRPLIAISSIQKIISLAPSELMGVFSKKRTLPRSEAAMVAAADLGPINVHLDNYHLTFEDCQWTPDYDYPDMPENASCLEQELIQLRKEKRKMKKELDKFVCQAQEMKDLKERWNLLDFKYQLLLDMWTMRALDDKEGGMIPGSTKGRSSSRVKSSPKRSSGHSPSTRSSPTRDGHYDSPSKTRNGC